jgi:hypothetical protein
MIDNEDEIVDNIHDPEWRFRNLYAVDSYRSATLHFEPNEVQMDPFRLPDTGARVLINQHERRKGVTTAVVLRLLDKAIFSPNERCTIVTLHPDLIMGIVRAAVNGLPGQLKDATLSDFSREKVAFHNGSILHAARTVRGIIPTQLFVHWIDDIEAQNADLFDMVVRGILMAVPKHGNIFISGNEFLHPDSVFQDMVKAAKNGENGFSVEEVL